MFDILTSDQELEVCLATYGPQIDQSQHMKSVSHIMRVYIGGIGRKCISPVELLSLLHSIQNIFFSQLAINIDQQICLGFFTSRQFFDDPLGEPNTTQ